jgi:hypothetical protein
MLPCVWSLSQRTRFSSILFLKIFEHFSDRLLGRENHRVYWLLAGFVGSFGGESRKNTDGVTKAQGSRLKAQG